MAKLLIGTSGFDYDYWEGVFYPPQSSTEVRLSRYIEEFGILEFTQSFNKWPSVAQIISFKRRLPKDFVLDMQAPRALTHLKWLLRPEAWVAKLAGTWHVVGSHRGAIRVGLPESMERDDDRLRYFLERLPGWIKVAFEFENKSWVCDEVMDLLEKHQASYVVTSGAWLPCLLRATAPLVYVRLYGPDNNARPGGSYTDNDLEWWADRFDEWLTMGHDIHCFFVNAAHGISSQDARRMKALVEGK